MMSIVNTFLLDMQQFRTPRDWERDNFLKGKSGTTLLIINVGQVLCNVHFYFDFWFQSWLDQVICFLDICFYFISAEQEKDAVCGG